MNNKAEAVSKWIPQQRAEQRGRNLIKGRNREQQNTEPEQSGSRHGKRVLHLQNRIKQKHPNDRRERVRVRLNEKITPVGQRDSSTRGLAHGNDVCTDSHGRVGEKREQVLQRR